MRVQAGTIQPFAVPDAVPLKTAGHFLRLSGKHHKTPIVQLRLSSRWCGWRDSNSHTSRHWHLKPACLPVPPHPLSQEGESTKVRNCIRNCARKTSHTRYPRNGAAGEPDPRIHESGLLTPGSSSDAPSNTDHSAWHQQPAFCFLAIPVSATSAPTEKRTTSG